MKGERGQESISTFDHQLWEVYMYQLTNRISSLVLALFFLGTFSILPISPTNLSATTTSATTINESELIAKRGDGKHGGSHHHGHRSGGHHHHGGKHHHHSVGHRGGHHHHHHGHSHGLRGNYGYESLYGNFGLGVPYSYSCYPYSRYSNYPSYRSYSTYTTPRYVYPDDDTTYYYYSLPVVYEVY